jgi:long-chain acyl-CoA synthetase
MAFESLVSMQRETCRANASRPVFGTKVDGTYRWMTYAEFGAEVDRLRGGLHALGVRRGDRVAIVANNRVEWAVAAYATYSLGAQFVPMYEAQQAKEWQFIVEDAGASVLIVANEAIHALVASWPGSVGVLRDVVVLDASPGAENSYPALLGRGDRAPVPAVLPASGDVAGLIYTSGTTGEPKGVILTHGNFCSNIEGVHRIFPVSPDDVSLSFLPWAHSFGQTVELHVLLSMGASMGLAESVATLLQNFQEVRPTLLFAVPRVFNRIYDGIRKRIEDEKPAKRWLMQRALMVSRERRLLAGEGRHSVWLDAQHRLLDRLVLQKIRDRFGGRFKYAFSGGAALSREVAEFVDDVGIMVFEGYGLTETAPIATANSPEHRRIGTIGKPLPGVDIVICDEAGRRVAPGHDGEIVVIGPNVMWGYHNRPDATAEVIFEFEGRRAFRTGDMGRIEDDGFVRITGRFKEQYKLENGKYVVPSPLEEQLKLSLFIANAFVYGDNRPFNVALVVPDAEVCGAWLRAQGEEAGSLAQMAGSRRLHQRIGEEIARYGSEMKGFERPERWALLPEDFTLENDLLTPSLKLKRRNVVARHGSRLEELYRQA